MSVFRTGCRVLYEYAQEYMDKSYENLFTTFLGSSTLISIGAEQFYITPTVKRHFHFGTSSPTFVAILFYISYFDWNEMKSQNSFICICLLA